MAESIVTNEDCMEMMSRYPDKFFDLAICDPPYFKNVGKMGYFGQNNSSIGVKRGIFSVRNWDNEIPDQKWFDEVKRVSKHQIIWGINYFKFHHCFGRIVWDKVNGKSSFSDCEIASCSLHDTVRLFRYMWNGMCQGKSFSEPAVMQGNKKLNEKRIHQTQKPVILYKWLFNQYAKSGFNVIDTHLGSGSSRIAAHEAGINFYAAEIDEICFNMQELRFSQYLSQLKIELSI